MHAAQFLTAGCPAEVLHSADVPRPVPAHGQVLVRMLASPINPSDLMFIRGTYPTQPQLPQIPGFEGVGIVEASGGGWKGRLFTGRRVAVLNRAGGNWADYAVLPAANVIPLSRTLSNHQAATFFVNPATAWIMTQEVLRVPQGAWLLQTAATSALGRMVIRLGNALGFRTLNIVRRKSAVDELKAAGATEVVAFDPETDDLDSFQHAVQQIVGTHGLRYAIDPVGGDTAAAVLNTLSLHGRLLLFGTLCDQPLQFAPRTLMSRQAAVEGFWLGNFMDSRHLVSKLQLVKRITRLVLDGTLATDVRATFHVSEIQQAIAAAQQPGQFGKVLLTFGNA